MYYLRKKAKYSNTPGVSYRTVDSNFSGIIRRIWEVYSDLDSTECNANSERTIVSYINGYSC